MYSGVTGTMVLRYLHRNLGAAVQTLELNDEELMRVVFQESLMTYSKFFPYVYKIQITDKDVIDPRYPNTYRIPNDDRLEIFGIHRIWLSNMNQYGGSLLPLVNDPFVSQQLNDFLSKSITPTTWEFQAPNIVTIRPKIFRAGAAMLELKSVHPRHLKTIPIDMRDEFLRLCLDDVLISLYPIRHRFESFETPYGALQPFFEQVDNAAADRNELIERWRENLLRNGRTKRIWIA